MVAASPRVRKLDPAERERPPPRGRTPFARLGGADVAPCLGSLIGDDDVVFLFAGCAVQVDAELVARIELEADVDCVPAVVRRGERDVDCTAVG
jgi:hypothetical protein